MRTRTGFGILGTIALLTVAACGDASTSQRGGLDVPPRAGGDIDEDSTGAGGEQTIAEPTDPAAEEETLPGQPVTMIDSDKDGIADEKDCDSTNPAIGMRLVEDSLAADATLFAPATGFPTTSWSFADSAYRQTRLADGGDAAFFMGDQAIGDVDVEVRTASTEISSALGPTLRQMFVLVGAKMENGTFTAWGCGAEVVAGMSPTQRTSVVKLSGAPGGAITTTAIQRTARTLLKEGEDYAIKARVSGGKITCTVMQGQDLATLTTAEAIDQGEIKGALGFYTRQTKAYFKNVKACKLQVSPAAPN